MDPGPTFGTSQHTNLNLGTILELAPFFAPRLDPDDRLMLSGLLEDQASEAVGAGLKPAPTRRLIPRSAELRQPLTINDRYSINKKLIPETTCAVFLLKK